MAKRIICKRCDTLTMALNAPTASELARAQAVGLLRKISMHKDENQIVETAVEARGGLSGSPVLLVLLVSWRPRNCRAYPRIPAPAGRRSRREARFAFSNGSGDEAFG